MYVDEEIFPLLSEAKLLIGHSYQLQETREMCFHPEKTHDGNRRRPRYAITVQQLQYFIHFGFKASEIASMLGVSEPLCEGGLRILICQHHRDLLKYLMRNLTMLSKT